MRINKTSNDFLQEINDRKIRNCIFVLDAKNMRTWNSLFKEFKEVVEFPDYCGLNRDAFDECMMDLPEWLNLSGYIFFIENSDALLVNEDNYKCAFRELMDMFNEYGEEYAKELYYGENNVNNRKKHPFRVILSQKV